MSISYTFLCNNSFLSLILVCQCAKSEFYLRLATEKKVQSKFMKVANPAPNKASGASGILSTQT